MYIIFVHTLQLLMIKIFCFNFLSVCILKYFGFYWMQHRLSNNKITIDSISITWLKVKLYTEDLVINLLVTLCIMSELLMIYQLLGYVLIKIYYSVLSICVSKYK